MRAIPATLMRGGTSKGLVFHATELPDDVGTRNKVLLSIMGSPDPRQIDGIGGAHPLTSKVAIVSPSADTETDVDYLFLQVAVDQASVSDAQNCGNMLAAVGPWAVENNIVPAKTERTDVRIRMVNSGGIAIARLQTPDGLITYDGVSRIDGVPGTSAPISLDFLDVAGSSCGALLPTGKALDVVDGLNVTCIDNGMPVVLLSAAQLGLSGKESPSDLEANENLKARLEKLRLYLGPIMGLGDVSKKTVPKMTIASAPSNGGTICTRSFIPHRVHEAVGVLAAVSIASACFIPGSIAHAIAPQAADGRAHLVGVEHPTGLFETDVAAKLTETGTYTITRSAVIRTARKLMSGDVFVPNEIWLT